MSPAGLTHHTVTTADGVQIHAVETGNPSGPPILFVHGITGCWQVWAPQLADEELRAAHRLVAVDLRGHGASQGALGALDANLRPLPALPADSYNDGTMEGTSRLWANDLEAVITGLGLTSPALVGWSYGGVVVQGYLFTHGGLGAARAAMLVATTPVLLPPGTPDGGAQEALWPAAGAGLVSTLPVDITVDPPTPNEERDIAAGLIDFLRAAWEDDTGRPLDPDVLLAAGGLGLLSAPVARLAIMGRAFDYRPFHAELGDAERGAITVISAAGDRIFNVGTTDGWWARAGLENVVIPDEGHAYVHRSPDDFNPRLAAFAG